MTSGEAKSRRKPSQEESNGLIEAHHDPMRVLPDSRVNFDRLTNEELTKRYVNRFKELQELRATYQKMLQTQKPEQRGKPPKPHIPR